jgi:hypothetical protein
MLNNWNKKQKLLRRNEGRKTLNFTSCLLSLRWLDYVRDSTGYLCAVS